MASSRKGTKRKANVGWNEASYEDESEASDEDESEASDEDESEASDEDESEASGEDESKASKVKQDKQLQRIHKMYSLVENSGYATPTCTNELRIVILGKTGVGKSETGNVILGQDIFKTDLTTSSVTKQSSYGSTTFNNRKIFVVDTPGFQDCDRPEDEILEEVASVVTKFRRGIHVFVYVFNLASPQFSKEDTASMTNLEIMFGGEAHKYRLLVFTHADSHLGNKTLNDFVKDETARNSYFADFMKTFRGNIVAVNNKCKIKGEKERNRNAILGLADKIFIKNKNKSYTNAVFERAQTLWNAFKRVLVSVQMSETVKGIIEEIIEDDPRAATKVEKLKQKVRNKIEEELAKLDEKRLELPLKDVACELAVIAAETDKQNLKKYKADNKKRVKNLEEAKKTVASKGIEETLGQITTKSEGYFNQLLRYLKDRWISFRR